MSKGVKTTILILLAVLVLVTGLLVGILVLDENYLIDWHLYPKRVDQLDLRGEDISVEHYEKIHQKMPNCRILWDVPFQGGTCPSDTQTLTVTSLTQEDVAVLDYVKELQTVDARSCKDYDALLTLHQRRPELQIEATVSVGGKSYTPDTTRITTDALTAEEVSLLVFLPELAEVDANGCHDYEVLMQLRERYPQVAVQYAVAIGAEEYASDTRELTLTGIDAEEMAGKLVYLTELETVNLVNPAGQVDYFTGLMEEMPETVFHCEKEVEGRTVSSADPEVDLSGIEGLTLEDAAEIMAWFPAAEQVFLGEIAEENEAVAQFREEKREDYKVVWTVKCGTIPVRTDAHSFIPIKHNVYYFFDEDCDNLRYCEDMVALDVGHMSIHRLDWLDGMDSLKYLILAHTQLRSLEGIEVCKELLFLEVDHTYVTDYSPLLECTSLQDLNLGNTYGDPEPLYEMTWLNNLWIVGRGYETKIDLQENMPASVNLQVFGTTTVGYGWRNLQNYYDMRDALGMHYMSW